MEGALLRLLELLGSDKTFVVSHFWLQGPHVPSATTHGHVHELAYAMSLAGVELNEQLRYSLGQMNSEPDLRRRRIIAKEMHPV